MCIASSNGVQHNIYSILESYSGGHILECEWGDISSWPEWREILHCDFSKEMHGS